MFVRFFMLSSKHAPSMRTEEKKERPCSVTASCYTTVLLLEAC